MAVLIGAPAVRELQLDAATLAAEFGGETVGHPRVPGLVLPLTDGGWSALGALVGRIGADRMAAATGITTRRPPESRHAP